MENPFLNLFRRKKENEVSQIKNVETNVVTENTETEFSPDEKELLLQNISEEDLDILRYKYNLNKEDITLYFARLLIDNPPLLSFLKEDYINMDIVHKMNKNELRIADIHFYNKELFKFPIFLEEDQVILEILNDNIVMSDKPYISFDFDSYQKYMNFNEFIDSKIPSFFENEEIIVERKKAIPLVYNNIYNNSTQVITPLDKENIFQKNIFDMYYSGEFSFQKEIIISISYEDFLNWIQSEDKKEILKKCQVVIKEDPNFWDLSSNIHWIYQNYSLSSNSIQNNQINRLKIQANHLLYIIHHSNIGTDLIEYYQYEIAKLISEAHDIWNFYFLEEQFKNIGLEIQKKIKHEKIRHFTENFNQLALDEKLKEINVPKFSVNIFMRQFDNFHKASSFEILNNIAILNPEDKKEVLSNKIVIKKLRELLSESSSNQYLYYEKFAKILDIDDIFNIFGVEFIKQYFQEHHNQYEYRFFYTILKKDINQSVKYFLTNEDYFHEFIKDIDKYSFDSLDYSLLIKLLKKIELSNLNIKLSFLGSIDKELQFKLLEEEFQNDFLVKIVKNCNHEVQQVFFLEDKRFSYLFDKFPISYLIDRKYKVCDDVLYKKEFFAQFKSTSMIEFRANINRFLSYQPNLFFEENTEKYEDDLILQYDVKDGLFAPYKYLLENISLLDNRDFINNGIDFFYDTTLNYEIRKYLQYNHEDDNISIASHHDIIKYLKKVSKRKLNELIIDRLFKDNIYNVFLNIKEMLRFHKGLSENEKVFSLEEIAFYEQILNIDQLSEELILEIYNNFKDKNVALMFYQDLQKIKNKSYEKIKKDLFQPHNMKELEDNELSSKYGIPVFDLREKNYVILARCLTKGHEDLWRNRRDCYTLLSDENSLVFYGDGYVYGYSGFDNDCVLHIFEGDSYSSDVKYDELNSGSDRVNRIMNSREIATNSSWYSEIQIINKKDKNNPNFFETLKPSFLIVYDEINEKILKEAKLKNLPICIISHNLNKELVGKIPFNEKLDMYITDYSSLFEFNKRKTR